MTHAYNEIYLGRAQKTMGEMLHFAVYDMKWDISHYFDAFINTGLSDAVYRGEPRFIAGMSGYEMAYEVYYRITGSFCSISPNYSYDKSPEYFVGWSLAYYSWYRDISYKSITRAVPIDEIKEMYHPYHEMDIRQFISAMDDKILTARDEPMLKRLRAYAQLTQKQLAQNAGISQRMIEQYEQGRKDIRHASAATVLQISQALGCKVEDLIAG